MYIFSMWINASIKSLHDKTLVFYGTYEYYSLNFQIQPTTTMNFQRKVSTFKNGRIPVNNDDIWRKKNS